MSWNCFLEFVVNILIIFRLLQKLFANIFCMELVEKM
jgi:hypothetical protein